MNPEIERRNELEDVTKIMKTRSGRRFMWRLLGICQLRVVAPPENPLVMAQHNGMRLVGNTILLDIEEADIDGYILMAKEAKARLEAKEIEDERRRESESD